MVVLTVKRCAVASSRGSKLRPEADVTVAAPESVPACPPGADVQKSAWSVARPERAVADSGRDLAVTEQQPSAVTGPVTVARTGAPGVSASGFHATRRSNARPRQSQRRLVARARHQARWVKPRPSARGSAGDAAMRIQFSGADACFFAQRRTEHSSPDAPGATSRGPGCSQRQACDIRGFAGLAYQLVSGA